MEREPLKRLKEILRYGKNAKADRERRLNEYYASEQDPEHFYEDIIFDPYPDSILRSIHDEELLVMREKTIYPIDKKDK